MDSHDRLLTAFLAGDLDPAAARRWDEHLLECEPCWRAVREDRSGRQAAELLRQPAPAGLADRVRFAEADQDQPGARIAAGLVHLDQVLLAGQSVPVPQQHQDLHAAEGPEGDRPPAWRLGEFQVGHVDRDGLWPRHHASFPRGC